MDALGATAQCHKGPSQDRAGHHTHQPPYFHLKPKRDYHALGSMLNPIGKGQRQAKQSKATQKQIKSNSDATRVTCYPPGRVTCYLGARVSHGTAGNAKPGKSDYTIHKNKSNVH